MYKDYSRPRRQIHNYRLKNEHWVRSLGTADINATPSQGGLTTEFVIAELRFIAAATPVERLSGVREQLRN